MNEAVELLMTGEVVHQCEFCGQMTLVESMRCQEFHYGAGVDAILLKVDVPVFWCEPCQDGYTDWRGEELRAGAVRAHLHSLKEITA